MSFDKSNPEGVAIAILKIIWKIFLILLQWFVYVVVEAVKYIFSDF